MDISRFNTKPLYIRLWASVVVCLGIAIALFTTGHSSASSATTIVDSKAFATAYIPSKGLRLQDLPVVRDLPLTVSWSQTLRIREYLYRQTVVEPSAEAYFRQDSQTTTSDGSSFLIDAPAIKKTFIVQLLSDGILSIGCGAVADQKDASWKCAAASGVGE